jgi:DNA processing protein
MDQERLALMALHFVPGIGDYLTRQLVSYCGSAQQVFKLSKSKLLKVPGIGEVTASAIPGGKTYQQAEKEFRKAEREDARILFFIDKAYPTRMRNIDDAPVLFYIKGNINLNVPKVVAIVGTRQATDYGRSQVEAILEGLKAHETLIVSGLAYGIDIHAHKCALKNALATIGVLGSGIDIIYPASHKDIARKMINQGGLVSEHHFGTKPDAHNFPARNRIIAGLCDALVVVEAALKGGALITAEIANSYNRDVFAVPGNIGETYSEGCNKLIKINKANLMTSVADLEYIMNWKVDMRPDNQLSLDLGLFDKDELRVMEALREKSTPSWIDELSIKTDIDHGYLSSLLLSLEFKNAVVSLPGKLYRVR